MTGSQGSAPGPNQKSDPGNGATRRERLVKLGWRQGAILPPELIPVVQKSIVAPLEVNEQDLVVVVTHDCDVIHESLEAEPYLEVVRLRKVDALVGNFTFGKNPRRLQFSHRGSAYEAWIWDKRQLARDELLKAAPADALGPAEIRELGRWISKRYHRAAFPNAFEERISEAQKDLREIFRPASAWISGVYILITDKELSSDEVYEIDLIATMPTVSHDNPLLRAKAHAALMKVAARLKKCPGVDVFEPEVVSEKNLSVADLRDLKRWDYDSLSARDESHPRSPEQA